MGKQDLTGTVSMRVVVDFNQEGKREAKSGCSSEVMARDDEGLGYCAIREALKHSYRKLVSGLFFSAASISNRSERQTGDLRFWSKAFRVIGSWWCSSNHRRKVDHAFSKTTE